MLHPMFVERKVCYSALCTNLVRWHAIAVSLPLSDIILAQLACPLNDVMFCLHSEITNLFKHWLHLWPNIFFGLSGFRTKAQNKESQIWLYSVRWLLFIILLSIYILCNGTVHLYEILIKLIEGSSEKVNITNVLKSKNMQSFCFTFVYLNIFSFFCSKLTLLIVTPFQCSLYNQWQS
jgi:hypothetical protein